MPKCAISTKVGVDRTIAFTNPSIVRMTLMKKSGPQPAIITTPKGGTSEGRKRGKNKLQMC